MHIGICGALGNIAPMMKELASDKIRLAIMASAFVLSACATALAEEPAQGGWSQLQTHERFETGAESNHTELKYRVEWNSLELDEEAEGRTTTISATSYLCECGGTGKRPVLFAFNGGPGASSSPLHFALGPRKRDEGAASFPSNPHTVIGSADLVFIDPVETGFSRAASLDGKSKYLGVAGDVEAVSNFMRRWLIEHDRETDPVFILGQSYGGFRLSNLLPAVSDLNVSGLLMVSPAIDMSASNSDMNKVFSFPTMAATAWKYGRSDIQAESERDAWSVARDFAESDYLLALQKGDELDPDTEARVASEFAGMAGLPVGFVLERNLRVPTQDFLEALLSDDNRLVSRLNTGVSQEKRPPVNTERPDGANDPSLGLGRSNKIVSEEIGRYLERVTGATRDDGYRSLNLDANFAWDWRDDPGISPFSFSAAGRLSEYLNQTDDVRLLVFGGYRDLAVPLLETQYVLTHSNLPQERVELIAMEGGHSPYAEDGLDAEFSQHVERFIRAAVIEHKKEEVQ